MACESNLCVSAGGMFLGHPLYFRKDTVSGYLSVLLALKISDHTHSRYIMHSNLKKKKKNWLAELN